MNTALREYKRECSLQRWIGIVQECRSSGQAPEEWCPENGVSIHTYRKKQTEVMRYLQQKTSPQFVEVSKTSQYMQSDCSAIAKIRKTGYEIEIYDTVVLVEVMQRC